MAGKVFPSVSPWAGAFALGSALVWLAVLSGQHPMRPWTRPAPPKPMALAPLIPLHPVAYHPRPITIKPSELLAMAGQRAPEESIRVLLTDPLQEGRLKITSTSGLLVINPETHRLIAQVPGNMTYAVGLSDDARALSGPGGSDLPAKTVRIEPISPDTPMDTGKRSYLGALEVRIGDKGLEVINEVAREDYIVGVVAGEAARSFPLEALKAQAVAARTYALSQSGHRGNGVDVVDTVADQVYTGAGVAWPECRQAVAETAGQIATYGGRPIVAYFSADCGGYTRTNTAAGLSSTPLPYLQAVRDAPAGGPDYCSASPKHTWSTRLTTDQIAPLLNEKLGTEIKALKAIHFTRTYYDGRVGEVEVEGLGAPEQSAPNETAPAPSVAVAKRPARIAPTAAEGRPNQALITQVHDTGESEPEKATPDNAETPVPAAPTPAAPSTPDATSDTAPKADAPAGTPAAPVAPQILTPPAEPAPAPRAETLRAEQPKVEVPKAEAPKPEAPEASSPNPESGTPNPGENQPVIRRVLKAFDFRKIVGTKWLRSQIMSVAQDGDGAWVFSGRGYGHGVGLCQWGACGMARLGIAYDRILKHYYTGIDLQKDTPRTGTLTGLARDDEGHPLAGATITLAGTDRTLKTDAQGRFTFNTLPAATYDIVVTPAKGASAMSLAWDVKPDETTDAMLDTG